MQKSRQTAMEMRQRLLSFIEKEREETWSQVRKLYALPPEKRVEEGECITGLRLLGIEGDEALFLVEENLSRFRAGDPLYLSDGKSITSGIKCEFVDYEPVERLVRVSLHWSKAAAESLEMAREYVLDRRVIDTFSQRISAVEAVFGSERFSEAGRAIMLDLKAHTFGDKRKAERLLKGRGLDPSQAEAFKLGYTTSPALIQGPPGTGKTCLLAELARAFAEEDRCRVLVCCFTHRAINNALNKVVSAGVPEVFKISSPAHVDDLDPSIQWDRHWSVLPLPDHSFVLGATPYAAYRMALEVPFDVVIFDEAGQLTLDLALMGMCCSDRWVFIGDHMQMAPVLLAKHDDDIVRKSAFEHLFQVYPSVLLEITYRMNEELCRFPSKQFYEGRLKPAEEAKERRLPQRKVSAFADVLDPDKPSVFVEVNHRGSKMRSREEAKLVAHLAAELMRVYSIPPQEIAVITPFRAQAGEIRIQLARLTSEKGLRMDQEIVVDTVERMQGQEREVVLISLATSDTAYLRNKLEFFFKPNRLNVSITRARTKRIIVGSKHLLKIRPKDEEDRAMVKVLRELHRETPKLDYTDKVKELK